MIILGVGISFDTSAQFNQFKELKNLVGGEEKEEKYGGDITAIQDALIADLTDALGDVLSAQALLDEAQGNKELASTIKNTADTMAGRWRFQGGDFSGIADCFSLCTRF